MTSTNIAGRPTADDNLDDLEMWFFEAFGEIDAASTTSDTPAPSDDIWKKFELLPTPPISPQHETNYCSNSEEELQLVSDTLDDMDILENNLFNDDFDLTSNLIQDCMWSQFNKEFTSKSNTSTEKKDNSCNLSSSKLAEMNINGLCGSNSDLQNTSNCVDPMSIFPYHPTRTAEADSLGNETPSDSEDEEIDVVTVNSEKTQFNKKRPILPASSSMCAQVAAMHNYTAPAPSSPPSPAHSSSSGYGSASPSPPPTPVIHHHNYYSSSSSRVKRSYSHFSGGMKKLKIMLPQNSSSMLRPISRHHRHHRHKRRPVANSSSSSSSRNSSDSEDSEGRRSMHNILERKRRDDLKTSFMTLRDNVPDLDTQERAPKVVILKKAADFIHKLNRQHSSYLIELERQKKKNDQLRHKLSQLKNMC